ncbi:MAG: hypothetical protein L0154_22630 [Chloroflexi bacterium]|nr:hypothetical protein [Chloroflexota bacterium]
MGKRKKGSTRSFSFSLNLDDEEQFALAEEIDNLKVNRQFSPTIRDALRLILDLKAGKIDVLGEMFPELITSAPDDLLNELEEIKKLLESPPDITVVPEEKSELSASGDLLDELKEIKKLLTSLLNMTDVLGDMFPGLTISAADDLLVELKEIKKLLTSTSPMIQPIAQQSQWNRKQSVVTEITEKNVGTGDGSSANNLLSSLNNF